MAGQLRDVVSAVNVAGNGQETNQVRICTTRQVFTAVDQLPGMRRVSRAGVLSEKPYMPVIIRYQRKVGGVPNGMQNRASKAIS